MIEHPRVQAHACAEETLWTTHDHALHDHIVGRGGPWVVGRAQRMRVHTLTDARVRRVAS